MSDQPIIHDTKEQWAMWFGLLGGAVAWLVHLIAAWAIAEFGCIAGLQHYVFMGIHSISWSILVVSIILLAVAVVATVIAWKLRRQFSQDETARDAGPYMAGAGFITSGVCVLIILAQTLPILFFLRRC